MEAMTQMKELAVKYKYVLVVLIAGLALMLLPGTQQEETVVSMEEPRQQPGIQQSLEAILSNIQGVGRVQVLLTEAQGTRTIYVSDESAASDSRKTDAVILTNSDRTQRGLVSQVIPPVYQGAIIVCQGGDNPAVRLAVVEAVCDATGLSADKISVLKMK